jgi:hypothetical protein
MKTRLSLGPLAALSVFFVAFFSFEAATSFLLGLRCVAIVLTDTDVPLSTGLFGSRERQRVDGAPLAGARGYLANQSLNLLGD